MEDRGGLAPGTDESSFAPELNTHTHTLTRTHTRTHAHTRTHHPLALARAADRLATRAARIRELRCFPRDVGCRRAHVPADPTRPSTRPLLPLIP